jgi:capsular exopolysaccharide synthesis family protein
LDLAHQAASARGDFLEQQVKKMSQKLADPGLRLSDESKTDQAIYDQLLSNLRESRMAESNQSLGVVVVDAALPESSPVKPQKSKILEVGLFLGLFVGFQLALLLNWLGDRVSRLEKLNIVTGLPNYTVIPDFRQYLPASSRDNVIGAKSLIQDPAFAGTDYLEGFRLLRTNLSYAQTEKTIETVSILSPVRGEGKTLTNANLALSMAQVGKKVLLVDADLRKPGLGSLFGIEPKGGLGLPAALAGQGPWKSMVVSSGIEHLDLLPNRTVVPNATELLSGEVMKRFIEEAKKAYDFVVFDGAPILHLTDSLILATLVDGVVLLARNGSTRSKELAEAVVELASVKARVVGTILNAVKPEKGIVGHLLLNAPKMNVTPPTVEAEGKRPEKMFLPFQWVLGFFKWLLP